MLENQQFLYLAQKVEAKGLKRGKVLGMAIQSPRSKGSPLLARILPIGTAVRTVTSKASSLLILLLKERSTTTQ